MYKFKDLNPQPNIQQAANLGNQGMLDIFHTTAS
jgi:hypothetical protein